MPEVNLALNNKKFSDFINKYNSNVRLDTLDSAGVVAWLDPSIFKEVQALTKKEQNEALKGVFEIVQKTKALKLLPKEYKPINSIDLTSDPTKFLRIASIEPVELPGVEITEPIEPPEFPGPSTPPGPGGIHVKKCDKCNGEGCKYCDDGWVYIISKL